jgi:hypothetical protein
MEERMTVCNMAIEGGGTRRTHRSGRRDLSVFVWPSLRSEGQGF